MDLNALKLMLWDVAFDSREAVSSLALGCVGAGRLGVRAVYGFLKKV